MTSKIKLKWEVPANALAKFDPSIKAKQDDSALNIYSTIGEYGDGSGITAKLVSSVLRKADGADVTVNINSPGGDFFEGLAIHSLLSEYEGKVKVKVLGMAASAASVVALAGDEIEIAESGFFMIHNAWTIAIGNRHDMKQVAGMLAQFDESMVKLYTEATGQDERTVKKMMDEETWIMGPDAVEQGFAKALLGEDNIEIDEEEKKGHNAALRKMDVALAKAGMPRSERRKLIKEITGTQDAAPPTPSAGNDLSVALKGLLETMNA